MTKIPLLVPHMPTAAQLGDYLAQIDVNRSYTNFGPLCREFERRILDELDPAGRGLSVTTVSNCTVGLELALQSASLPPRARILIPSLTFVATATAVVRAGHVPVLADVDPDNWTLTPAIAAALVGPHRVDAVMPVSTFGYAHDPSDWDRLSRECRVPVVIDAAGAFGNQQAGETTDVVFSFHATKSFGAAEGGVVVSRNRSRVEKIRRLSNFGIDLGVGTISEFGTNAKMSEYHCAIGLASFDMWAGVKSARVELHRRYQRALADTLPTLRLQQKDESGIYPLLPVLVPAGSLAASAAAFLAARDIEARRWYCPPLHRHPALAGAEVAGDLSVSDDIGGRILGIPFFIGMRDDEMQRVVQALSDWLEEGN